MRRILGRRFGYFVNWESVEYLSLAYADREYLSFQYDGEYRASWVPTELLRVLNSPSFSYHRRMIMRGSVLVRRRLLNAVDSLEFVFIFLAYFWDAAERDARRKKVADSRRKMYAPGRRYWSAPVPIPVRIGFALSNRFTDVRDVTVRTGFHGGRTLLAYIRTRQKIDREAVSSGDSDGVAGPHLQYD